LSKKVSLQSRGKDKFLSYNKSDKDLPALKELIDKVSLKDIFDEVESVFRKEAALGRQDKVIIEFKEVEKLIKLHEAQVLNSMLGVDDQLIQLI